MTTAATTTAASDSLLTFRRLAKADEEESLLEDLSSIFLANPFILVILAAFVVALSFVPAPNSGGNSQDMKKRTVKSTAIYPSRNTVLSTWALLGLMHSLNFDVNFGRLISNDSDQNSIPTSSLFSYSDKLLYADFTTFYQEAYVDAHVDSISRISHLLLASLVVTIWIWDTRLAVASISALLVGAISTVLLQQQPPFVEMAGVLVMGMTISRVWYGTAVRWVTFYMIWILLDYTDHFVFGGNGSVAMYLGQHYISWALIGQLQLGFNILAGAVRQLLT